MKTLSFLASTQEDTFVLGFELAKHLFPGAFVALYGGLGAGKTVFARGVGVGLGTNDVCSPTFTIVHEYPTTPRLFHFDVYRLSSSDELYDIGFDDYQNQNGVILMEWPENVEDALPLQRLDVHIAGSGFDARRILFTARGALYEQMLSSFKGKES